MTTGIGSTVLAFSFQVWAQQFTSPTHTAIIVSLEPVFAAITSWLMAGEHMGAAPSLVSHLSSQGYCSLS
jgi:drug/metabolite transporter (DMT)-like permease